MDTLSYKHSYCEAGWCTCQKAAALMHTLIVCKYRLMVCEQGLTSRFLPACSSSLRAMIVILPNGIWMGLQMLLLLNQVDDACSCPFSLCPVQVQPWSVMGNNASTHYHLTFRSAQGGLWAPHPVSEKQLMLCWQVSFTLNYLCPVYQNSALLFFFFLSFFPLALTVFPGQLSTWK